MRRRRALSTLLILLSSAIASAQVERFESPGNLEAKNPLLCVPLEQVTSEHTPADIYDGIGACLERKDYASAVRLFAMATAYGRFDMLRVADPSAHEAMEVLKLSVLGNVGEEAQQGFTAAFGTELQPGSPRLAYNCAVFGGIGRPTYHPTYMIQHGLDASVPWADDSLVEDFDAVTAWNDVMEAVLECEVDAPPGK